MPELNLAEIFGTLGPNAALRIANEARPNSEYLFNDFLPEVNSFSYEAKGGNIIIRSVMAGLAAMDSPYPEGGAMSVTTFLQETAKIANRVRLSEEAQRQVQQLDLFLRGNGGASLTQIRDVLFNFYNKLVVQPHLDTREWLRGQALITGGIDWTYNSKRLLVDYGVPSANFLTARTSTNGYGGSASKFWTDVLAARSKLRKGGVRAFVAHPDTVDMIILNSVNSLEVVDVQEINATQQATTVRQLIGTTVSFISRLVTLALAVEIIEHQLQKVHISIVQQLSNIVKPHQFLFQRTVGKLQFMDGLLEFSQLVGHLSCPSQRQFRLILVLLLPIGCQFFGSDTAFHLFPPQGMQIVTQRPAFVHLSQAYLYLLFHALRWMCQGHFGKFDQHSPEAESRNALQPQG